MSGTLLIFRLHQKNHEQPKQNEDQTADDQVHIENTTQYLGFEPDYKVERHREKIENVPLNDFEFSIICSILILSITYSHRIPHPFVTLSLRKKDLCLTDNCSSLSNIIMRKYLKLASFYSVVPVQLRKFTYEVHYQFSLCCKF